MKRQTQVSVHCADSDIERTYPAIQMAVNGAKSTTVKEMSEVQGLGHWDIRINGFNLTGGMSNAMQFCHTVLDLPLQDDMLEAFEKSMS